MRNQKRNYTGQILQSLAMFLKNLFLCSLQSRIRVGSKNTAKGQTITHLHRRMNGLASVWFLEIVFFFRDFFDTFEISSLQICYKERARGRSTLVFCFEYSIEYERLDILYFKEIITIPKQSECNVNSYNKDIDIDIDIDIDKYKEIFIANSFYNSPHILKDPLHLNYVYFQQRNETRSSWILDL